jgi:phosphatidylglycerophosphate synthase
MTYQPVPPIDLLRDRISKKRWEQPWHRLIRKVSIYLTWILLHSPISANGVTFLFLVTGVIGGVIFALGTPLAWIVGTVFVWLSILLDFSDGEVARYRQESHWFGDYLEETVHSVVSIAMYVGISLGVWRQAPGNPWPFVFALLALGSTLIIRSDANLLMKAQLHYYGLKRLRDIGSDFSASNFSATTHLNRWMYLVGMLIFDLGIYFIVLPILAVLNRMDVFLYFYGLTRSLAACYMIVQNWKRRAKDGYAKET